MPSLIHPSPQSILETGSPLPRLGQSHLDHPSAAPAASPTTPTPTSSAPNQTRKPPPRDHARRRHPLAAYAPTATGPSTSARTAAGKPPTTPSPRATPASASASTAPPARKPWPSSPSRSRPATEASRSVRAGQRQRLSDALAGERRRPPTPREHPHALHRLRQPASHPRPGQEEARKLKAKDVRTWPYSSAPPASAAPAASMPAVISPVAAPPERAAPSGFPR